MKNSLNDIRATFLDFFAKNGHEIVPSSSLVPHNDPTLMFTNAGMVQFKNVFTGAEKLKFNRAVSSQKCVRAGGKHNDLDNVGYTARHHTFFEMLGNFSFGDYFKELAIELAWKLITKEYGLAKDKITTTVYHTDDEAFELWKKIAGLPESKIIRIPTNDNFWAMGDTGPCGPCSEIFYDHGEKIPGGPPGSPDADGDRFIEIWNLVFMQYEQVDKETRNVLPKPSIDTGMGLERISAVMQGVHDNYDIDLFRHLITASQEASAAEGKEYLTSHRVIADHLRSSCFLIADGVMPGNEGRGYVLRRIMRRAMRHAHQIGCEDTLMHRLVPALVHEMGGQYPELVRAEVLIRETLKLEEERFRQTLDRGLKLLEEEATRLSSGGTLAGEAAFKLYDTYGFPLDLTQDILRGRNMKVDIAGFEKSMAKQKADARAAWAGSGDKATSHIWFEMKDRVGVTEFLGYAQDHAAAELKAIVVDGKEVKDVAAGKEATLVFNQTPFYGESGGQMGDTGLILRDGKIVAEISDTKKPLESFHAHEAEIKMPMKVGETFVLAINSDWRDRTRANHSATHLLHAALRRTLGGHVTQKGSLVAPEKLRFDFSHPKAMTSDELEKVEWEVNQLIWKNTPVETKLMTPDQAIEEGAMALFGEKYGDEVRVLSMGFSESTPYSVELCGGTHVRATGDIGLFKILSESAVASGIRRIEAVTREGAFHCLSQQDKRLKEISLQFKTNPEEIVAKLSVFISERKKLEKELGEAKKSLALGGGGGEEAKPETIGNVRFISKVFSGLDPKELRNVATDYLKSADVVFVGADTEGKASVLVAVGKELSAKHSAVELVKTAVETVGGKGGGGRPEMAQGGGPNVDKLPEAIEVIRKKLAA